MISRERFEELSELVASGEATAAEQTELERALTEAPALVDELLDTIEMEEALQRATGRPSSAVEPLPESVRRELEAERRKTSEEGQASTAESDGATKVVPMPAPLGKSTRGLPSWLALAAALLVLAGLAAFFLATRPSSKDIVVLTPRKETGFTQPPLYWDALPGQRYDAWILPAEGDKNQVPALFVVKGVRPPVAFADLKPGQATGDTPATALVPGQEYRLLVCIGDAGRVAGQAYAFHVSPKAVSGEPAPSLALAQDLAAAGRVSDALGVLARLPKEDRERAEAQALEKELRAKLSASSTP